MAVAIGTDTLNLADDPYRPERGLQDVANVAAELADRKGPGQVVREFFFGDGRPQ